MINHRSEIRAFVRAALASDPYFSEFFQPVIWPNVVDADSLPVIGVVTPQDRSHMEALSSTERTTMLQVALRRAGADNIEDILDEDGDVIEAIVLSALRAVNRSVFLRETTLVADTTGVENIGTMVLTFEVKTQRPEAVRG